MIFVPGARLQAGIGCSTCVPGQRIRLMVAFHFFEQEVSFGRLPLMSQTSKRELRRCVSLSVFSIAPQPHKKAMNLMALLSNRRRKKKILLWLLGSQVQKHLLYLPLSAAMPLPMLASPTNKRSSSYQKIPAPDKVTS